jgi:hypothetical protein
MRNVKDNENWLLVFKNSVRRDVFVLGSNGKTILDPRDEKSWSTLVQINVCRWCKAPRQHVAESWREMKSSGSANFAERGRSGSPGLRVT